MKLLVHLLIAAFLLQTASLEKPLNPKPPPAQKPAETNLEQRPNPPPVNPKPAVQPNPNPSRVTLPKEPSKPSNPEPAVQPNPNPSRVTLPKEPSKPSNPEPAVQPNPNPSRVTLPKEPSKPSNPEPAVQPNPNPSRVTLPKEPSKPSNPEPAVQPNPNPSRVTLPKEPSKPSNPEPAVQPNPNQSRVTLPKETPKPSKPNTTQDDDSKKPLDGVLGPSQCLDQKYTRWSCAKVFCPPWMRCMSGKCSCKIPYTCPKLVRRTCGLDGSLYTSMCQAKAISCRSNEAVFSHFNPVCKPEEHVKVTLTVSKSHDVVQINTNMGKMLVCGSDWDTAAANVVCRNTNPRGAEVATKVRYDSLAANVSWPSECVSVQCIGSELTLAECVIHKPKPLMSNTEVAVSKCYKEPKGECKKFLCVNGKCLAHEKTCNGVDDCGDNSDEMCCQSCRGESAFHCSSGVCIPAHAVRDGIRDCLGGDDELQEPKKTDDLLSDPKSEIKEIRTLAENQLKCGLPNMEYIYRNEDSTSPSRRKRLVGGAEALPTQIQWQVGVQEEKTINCGGAYIGGCWVLTAAHCVRPKPKLFHIKFSLWKKHRKLSTTDSIPVKNIIIHHQYNPRTYENDIALIQLEELNLMGKCIHDNPAVRSVCVPWSTEQFQPNHTCTISGWGRNKEGVSASTLKWANVTIIGNCEDYYKSKFLPGMECAGDLEGKVDSCQGDSGGPLVCKDPSGMSYVWGIVSWGDKCGEPNHPGVYTKVAHYFEWIRFNTGWPAVTKYNQ